LLFTLPNAFLSGQPWRDTGGGLIQAHGGGVLQRGKTYYWYGENKTEGYNNKVGVSCYSSSDLKSWKDEGVVLPKSEFPEIFTDKGVCERPKVLYNAKTRKYVMWAHMDANGYGVSEAGVAVADKPTGPFRWLYSFRPVRSSTFRDMNLFQDDDGRAYVLYSGEENQTMHVVRLNRDYTGIDGPLTEGENWARIFVGQAREAPAPFKYKGRYYIVSSGCTGWAPNPAEVAVADRLFGPWKTLGNPCVGEGAKTTFQSQSTCVLPVPGKPGAFVYMGDRWNPKDLANSTYVWLPMTVEGEKVQIHYRDGWDFSTFATLLAPKS
ncbi:hypothetical protein EON79_16390, partial [bacterium]